MITASISKPASNNAERVRASACELALMSSEFTVTAVSVGTLKLLRYTAAAGQEAKGGINIGASDFLRIRNMRALNENYVPIRVSLGNFRCPAIVIGLESGELLIALIPSLALIDENSENMIMILKRARKLFPVIMRDMGFSPYSTGVAEVCENPRALIASHYVKVTELPVKTGDHDRPYSDYSDVRLNGFLDAIGLKERNFELLSGAYGISGVRDGFFAMLTETLLLSLRLGIRRKRFIEFREDSDGITCTLTAHGSVPADFRALFSLSVNLIRAYGAALKLTEACGAISLEAFLSYKEKYLFTVREAKDTPAPEASALIAYLLGLSKEK